MAAMRLSLLCCLFALSCVAWWEQDLSTGMVWNPNAAIPAFCPTPMPPSGPTPPGGDKSKICCPRQQEPFLSDPNLFGTVIAKQQIALPASNQDFSRTFLTDSIRSTICPPLQGSIVQYDSTGASRVIGSAVTRWGGTQGICLQVNITISNTLPSFCWTNWHAYVDQQSIKTGQSSFPAFNSGIWMTGPFSGCVTGSSTIVELCPANPNSGQPGTGTGAAAWPLPGCGQPLYFSFHLGSSTTGVEAWVVPALPSVANSIGYVDGTGVPTPSCSSVCFNRTYPISCSTSKTTGASPQACGTLYVTSSGNALTLSFTPATGWNVAGMDIYLGNSTFNANSVTFSYNVGTPVTETPYAPIPFISSTSFAVSYNLNLNIGASTGVSLPCNSTMYLYVTPRLTLSGTNYFGAMSTASRIGSNWAFSDAIQRCCTLTNANTCGNTPCYQFNKFNDTFGWAKNGFEILTSRCCALNPVLDLVLGLLPEGTDNTLSGLIVGNISAVCNNGPSGPGSNCTMAMTFLYQVSAFRNLVGYYFFNPTTGSLVTNFFPQQPTAPDRGLVSVWPDVSMQNNPTGGGCLLPGDTLIISVPPGSVVGWFMRSAGSSWTSKTGVLTADVFPSIFSPNAGAFNSDDGFGHFGWVNPGYSSDTFILGVEDLSGLGDRDFNDVVFGMKVGGSWSLPGLPAFNPCSNVLVTQCKTFVPSNYAPNIFTPQCVAHITLDTGVGTNSKDCTGYYSIPPGWVIAPMDALGIIAARNYSSTWRSPCVVGLSPTGNGWVGYNATGPCSVTPAAISDPNDASGVGSCYNLACRGHLLLRQVNTHAPNCNAFNYGLYCNQTAPSQYYKSTSPSDPSALYINMVPSQTLTTPVFISVYNRIQIFVMIDTCGLVASPNDWSSAISTVQYLYQNSGSFKAVNLGVLMASGTSVFKYCDPTFNQNLFNSLCKLDPQPGTSTPGIVQSLTALLNAPQPTFFPGWQPDTVRFVYVLSKCPTLDLTTTAPAVVTNFTTAMANSGVNVIFIGTTDPTFNFFSNLISQTSVSRARALKTSWPTTDAQTTLDTVAQALWSQVYIEQQKLAGKFDIIKGADVPSFVTPSTLTYTIPNFGALPDPGYPELQLYTVTPGISVTLPSNLTGISVPRAVTWTVPQTINANGALTTFQTSISWNVPPSLPASNPISATFYDSTTPPFTVDIADPLTFRLDPNANLFDVVFLSSTFSQGSNWVNTANTFGGNTGAVPFALNTRLNIQGLRITPKNDGSYGVWNITYQLYDGCMYSPVGTILVTYVVTNVLPTCQNYTITLPYNPPPIDLDFGILTTESPLGSCTPSYITTSNCSGVVTGCSTCVTGTSCCATNQLCTATATCPVGTSTLCSGSSCPRQQLSCTPIGSCAAGQTCYGYTTCDSTVLCPSGYQDGMLCLYVGPGSTSTPFTTCCSQQRYHGAAIQFLSSGTGPGFGSVSFFSSGRYSPISYNQRPTNPPYNPVRIQPNAGTVGTGVWTYRVYRGTNSFATCFITITTTSPNPPGNLTAINSTSSTSSTTINVITTPGTIGPWTIRLNNSFTPNTMYTFRLSNPSVSWNNINATNFGVVNGTRFNSTTTFIGNFTTDANGNLAIPMQWSPLFTYPYGTTSTFRITATDPAGLNTNTVTVNLQIPPNVAPVCRTINPAPRPQNSSAFEILLFANDSNVQDNTNLQVQIQSRSNSNLGTLSGLGSNNTITPNSNTWYTPTVALPGYTNGTAYSLIYTPLNSGSGVDTITVCFRDTGNAVTNPCCSVRVNLTFVPTAPTTVDTFATTAQNIPVNITVPGTSRDNTLISIIITGINFANPSTTNLTFNGTNVQVGSRFNFTSARGSGNWTFTYVSSSFLSLNDTFTYVVVDTNGLVSTPRTGTIIGVATLQAPTVNNATRTGSMNSNIPITFNWGPTSTASNNYFDADSTQNQVRIVVNSLPPVGTLLLGGSPVTVGQVVTTGQPLTYAPPANTIGNTSFTFQAIDNTGLRSPNATMTLVTTSLNLPPTITIDVPSRTTARGVPANFTLRVRDTNSDQINVTLTNYGSFPFLCATPTNPSPSVQCSNLTFTSSVLGSPVSFTATPGPSNTLLVTIDNTDNWGATYLITATWSPGFNYFSDTTSGFFEANARNQFGVAPNVRGRVLISPNNPPVIQANPTNAYSINGVRGSPPIPLNLTATDPDVYQATNLTYTILTLPSFGVNVTLRNSTTPLDVGSVVSGVPGSSGNTSITIAGVQIVLPPYWYGTTNFTFLATDPLGRNSTRQTVVITVPFVNLPPQTSNVTVVVLENSCIFLSCGAVTPEVYTTAPITAFDPDLYAPGDTLSLTFDRLPSIGTLAWSFPYAPLTSLSPIPAGGLPSWPVSYQPAKYSYNTNCANYSDWTTCAAPLVVIPFTVNDYINTTASAFVNIYVIHVNHPPTSRDVSATASFGTPINVTVPGADVDGNLKTLVITGLFLNSSVTPPVSAATLLGPDGNPVTVGSRYNITTGGDFANNFTFNYTGYWSGTPNTDNFTYYVIDSEGLVSINYTAQIFMSKSFFPVYARGYNYTLAENTQILVNFTWGNSSNLTYGQHRWSPIDLTSSPGGQLTRVIVTSLPKNGTLTRDGVPVTVGTVLNLGPGKIDPYVLYKPNYLFWGLDSFNFVALDKDGQTSPTATNYLNVTFVDQPPHITLTPGTVVLVDRNSSQSLTVGVYDVDSPFINVSVIAGSLTKELINLPNSTFKVYDESGNLVTTFSKTNLISQTPTPLLTVPNPVPGVIHTFELEWSPSIMAPDGTAGNFTLIAFDGSLNSSETPLGQVQVTPNKIPTILEKPSGAYTVVVNQNSGPINVTLQATDLDPWHDKVLDIKVTSLPGVNVSLVNFPGANVTIPRASVSTGTAAPVTLQFAWNWYGNTTFNFTATDLLGAVSTTQVVTVIVNRVNQVPNTTNVTLVVPEDSCAIGCVPNSPYANITCADFEDSILQLTLNPATVGTVGIGPSSSVVGVTSTQSFNKQCPFNAWYQPPPLTHSTCVPGFNNVTGAGCNLYTVIPFTVCDTEGACSTAYINVIVTPVNHPPVTFDAFSTNRTTTFNLTGTDIDDNIEYIIIQSINITDRGTTTLTYQGTNLTVGMIIPGDGSGWPILYNNSGYKAVTDFFTYRVVDTNSSQSNLGTATVKAPEIIFPPNAWGSNFSVPEGKAIDIPFYYGQPPATNPANYFDFSGSQSQTSLIIRSLPTNGTLMDSSRQPLVVGSVIPPSALPTLVYQSVWGFNGIVNFDFVASNPLTGVSNVATMIINVTHVNRPPVIYLDPPSVSVDRMSFGTFTATVSDPDSPSINVVLTDNRLPFGLGSTLYSTFQVNFPNGTVSKTYNTVVNSLVDGTQIMTLDYGASPIGSNLSFTLSWGPTAFAPDGTAGSFSLYATDEEPLTSGTVTGNVAVTPNRAPFVQDQIPSLYNITLTEDAWNKSVITLLGSDPDWWHQQNLTFVLLSVPDGVILTKGSDGNGTSPIFVGNLPLVLDSTTATTNASTSFVNIFPRPGFSGNTYFDFQVVDPLGAISPPQRVNITIIHVNHPPVTQDDEIWVLQNFCVFPSCGAPNDVRAYRHASLLGSDPDGQAETDTLSLTWLDLLDPSIGTIGIYPAGQSTLANFTVNQTFTKPTDAWDFWFQPARNVRSNCSNPPTVCDPVAQLKFFVTDINNASSVPHTLSLYVVPVNQPPDSRDLEFTINENEILIIYFNDTTNNLTVYKLPATDPDNTDSEIGAESRGIVRGSRGKFFTSDGNVVPATGSIDIPGRYLKFVPDNNTFSLPGENYAQMYFNVKDLQPLYSPDYKITIFVNHVCLPVRWIGPTRIRTFEESAVLINLDVPDFWSSPNVGDHTIRLLTGPKNGLGYFFECTSTCSNITTFPHDITGPFYYVPPANPLPNFGDNYTNFDFQLNILDPQGKECAASSIQVNFIVDVTPVNDPPVFVPLWFTQKTGLQNACDEDTFMKLRFTAYDVDNTCDQLSPQILTLVQATSASLYVCNASNLVNGTKAFNCSDMHRLTTVEYIRDHVNMTLRPGAFNCSVGEVIWEISLIPYPNWNGLLRLYFNVWDVSLVSLTENVLARVYPINDPPSIVKGKTRVDLERYHNATDKKLYLVGTALGGANWTVLDGWSVDQRVLQGKTITTQQDLLASRQAPPTIAQNLNASEVLIYRVRTQVQDIDFFFGKEMKLTGRIINGQWVDPALLVRVLTPPKGVVCNFTTYQLNCSGVIGPMNTFLSQIGFPFVFANSTSTGYGLFTLFDLGNIDKWDRPLETNFTIVLKAPPPYNPYTVPIAAIAILPIVAAATAAIIAAAWVLLGKKAAAVVGNNFDAFMIDNGQGGFRSPLYEAGDREHISPLYQKN